MGNYDELTKYIKLLENDSFGERRYEETHYDDGNTGKMYYIEYTPAVKNLLDDIYRFSNTQYEVFIYKEVLKKASVKPGFFRRDEISRLDGDTVFAVLMFIARSEHFGHGNFLSSLKRGEVQACLQRLAELDD